MLRIAVLSFWHVHAKDYAAEVAAHPETELVAVWDEVADRGRAEAATRGVAFHERLDEVLARPDLDGVIVTTATRAHRDVIPAAAAAEGTSSPRRSSPRRWARRRRSSRRPSGRGSPSSSRCRGSRPVRRWRSGTRSTAASWAT